MTDIEELKAAISYDPGTGELRWKKAVNGRRARRGAICGGLATDGYRTLALNGKQYKAHRVAWAIHYGCWPAGQIDHIDHDKVNNAIANLRDVTAATNAQNLVRALATNKSGLLGVAPHREKWSARIMANGRRQHLGVFASAQEAHDAYLIAKRKLHQGNTL